MIRRLHFFLFDLLIPPGSFGANTTRFFGSLCLEGDCENREPKMIDVFEGLIDMVSASRQIDTRLEFTLRPLFRDCCTIDSDWKGGDGCGRRFGLFERCATHWTRYRSVMFLLIDPFPKTIPMECVITIRLLDFAILERIVTNWTLHVFSF